MLPSKAHRKTRAARTPVSTQAPPPARDHRVLLGALALLALTVLVYLRSFAAGFIWDDDAMLTDNRLIRAGDGLYRFWFTTEPPDYFPLVSSLLWMQWRLWGLNAAGYHVVQVLLHAGAAVMLWRVGSLLRIKGAWLAGAVFAVHPVNVETVSWITETKNTLPLLLMLCSLWAWLKSDGGASRRWYVASVALFVLALLGKTSVVMFPFVLLIVPWWLRGRITRNDSLRSLPFFGASAVLGFVTAWFQSHRAIMHTVIRDDGFASRLAIAGRAVWFYFSKAVLPINLSFVYPRWQIDPHRVLVWVPLVALGVAFAALWAARGRIGRGALAAMACYVLALVPVLGFLNIYFMRYSLVADHWQYVALPTLIIGGVGAAVGLAEKYGLSTRSISLASMILVCALAALSINGQARFQNMEVLFEDVIAKNPDAWIAHNNLGIVLAQKGQLDDAMQHYERALDLNPELSDAWLNIGNIHATRGNDPRAIEAYRKSLELRSYYKTHNALGEALTRTGKGDEARTQFELALKLEPMFWLANANLAACLMKAGDAQGAIVAFERAINSRPDRPDLHNDYAHALFVAGRRDEARQLLEQTIARWPDYAPARNNLSAITVRK